MHESVCTDLLVYSDSTDFLIPFWLPPPGFPTGLSHPQTTPLSPYKQAFWPEKLHFCFSVCSTILVIIKFLYWSACEIHKNGRSLLHT